MTDWVEFKDEWNKVFSVRASSILWYVTAYTHPAYQTSICLSNNKYFIVNMSYADVKTLLLKLETGKS